MLLDFVNDRNVLYIFLHGRVHYFKNMGWTKQPAAWFRF